MIVTGLSGSGKSVALHTLEDLGFYAIDNLPIALLPAFIEFSLGPRGEGFQKMAVGIDARSAPNDAGSIRAIRQTLSEAKVDHQVIYLQSDDSALIKRYSETRRKHPLASSGRSLEDAIRAERELLEPLASRADLFIDTTYTNVHELRELIRLRLLPENRAQLSILFKSFGFKRGVPTDVDFLFDMRCLPNPHWEPRLRPLTGLDPDVVEFLESQAEVIEMLSDISNFLDHWIPAFQRDNRPYLSVGIGCTGGQHRSVYMASALATKFSKSGMNVIVRHRELT